MSWGCICESTPLLLVPSWTACIRESHLDLFCSCSLQPSFFSVLSKKKHLITVAACQTSSVQKVTPPAPAHNLAQHIVKEHGILLMAEHQPALAIALSRNNHLVVRNFWTKHWCGYFFGQIGPTNAGIRFNINKDRPSISLHPNSDPCNYLPDINTPYVKLPWT